MAHKIQIGEKWYVAATAANAQEQPHVLKHDRSFGLFDRFGDVSALVPGKEGLYHDDTRYLSHLEMLVDGARPLYLGSAVDASNSLLAIDLMDPDLPARNGNPPVEKGTLHIFRAKLLWNGACHEHIRVTHHGSEPVTVRLEWTFDGDFVDLFEVRGMRRERRGARHPAEVTASEVALPYRGRDGVTRRTRVHFYPQPNAIDAGRAGFDVRLEPGSEHHL